MAEKMHGQDPTQAKGRRCGKEKNSSGMKADNQDFSLETQDQSLVTRYQANIMNNVSKPTVHWIICKYYFIPHPKIWYEHHLLVNTEGNSVVIMWDFTIYTNLVPKQRPQWKKKCF